MMQNRTMDVFKQRSVQIATLAVAASYLYVYLVSDEKIDLQQPLFADYTTLDQLGAMFFTVLIMPLIYMAITYLITRERDVDIADRAPERGVAKKEVIWLIIYGVIALSVGQIIGRAIWGEGIGLHLHGTLYGDVAPVSPMQVITWTLYNFTVYAVLPFWYFMNRGYGLQVG